MRRRGTRLATIVLDPTSDQDESLRREVLRADFVANLGHELKTPVGAMLLLADALSAEDDPAVMRRLAERVRDEAERIGAMLGELLELSRGEALAWTERDRVAIRDILADAIDRVRPAAHARDVRVEVFDGPSHLSVFGSRRHLSSALGNLLENAVKYSHEHGSVAVRVGRREGWIELSVSDRGIGIADGDLPFVFERFYRAASSELYAGTGLGLAIVREVATNHGGEICVDSAVGAGSTFTLRLPMALVRPADPPMTTR